MISKMLKIATLFIAILCLLKFQSLYATALIDAIKSHDYNKVEALLKQGVPIDDQDSDGFTATMVATLFAGAPERTKILELLLRYKPCLDVQNNNGDTALMIASNFINEKAMDLIFSQMKIVPKAVLLSFQQDDANGAVAKVLRRAILMKIICIVTPQLLDQLFKENQLILEYFLTGKLTLLATKAIVNQSQLLVIIPVPLAELGIKNVESTSEKNESLIDVSSAEGRFGFANLHLIYPEIIVETVNKAAATRVDFKQIFEDFAHIIKNDSPSHPSRFYLIGHGNLKTIAAIPLNLLDDFLFKLFEVGTEYVYINSCYAAANLPQIQAGLEKIITNQLSKKETAVNRPYFTGIDFAIVIQATVDAPTTRSGNIKAMFSKLDLFLQNAVWALQFGPGVAKPAITISDVISALGIKDIKSLPSIRFPGKTQFFRSINIGNMEIITESMLIEKGIKRTLELIAGSKSSDKSIAEEAEKKLSGNLAIGLPITSDIQYIQIFPIDLLDFVFVVYGQPKFISKLIGKGQHFIGKIIGGSYRDINELIDNSFFNIFNLGKGYISDRCWFIKCVDIPKNRIRIKKLVIHLYSIERKLHCDYCFINEKGEHIISKEGSIKSVNKNVFECMVRKWFEHSIPSQQTLNEATGGLEVTAEEKARLEQEKGGTQALKLIEPRFARTPENLFEIFMAD